MATPFANTQQALLAESLRGSGIALVATAVVAIAWLAWFCFADVGIYQVGPAQLEAEANVQAVETTIEGRIVSTGLVIGREVQAGDVLVQLDDTAIRLKLAEQQAQLAASRTQLQAINDELLAQQRALADMRKAAPLAGAELQLRYEQSQPAARLAEEELARTRNLRAQGFVTDLQLMTQEAAAQRRRGEVEELRLAITRQGFDRHVDATTRQAAVERLRRDAAELTGFIDTTTQVIQQTEHELQRYRVLAPTAGPLADVAELRPGMMVRAGERLASIVPSGKLKVTAQFPPAAIGHIRTGQTAALRLDGFPAEQYGRMTASVLRVAQEPRLGRIRVELAVLTSRPAIPLQHALPGTVEIEVERSSPATLAWRTAGALLHSAAPAATP